MLQILWPLLRPVLDYRCRTLNAAFLISFSGFLCVSCKRVCLCSCAAAEGEAPEQQLEATPKVLMPCGAPTNLGRRMLWHTCCGQDLSETCFFPGEAMTPKSWNMSNHRNTLWYQTAPIKLKKSGKYPTTREAGSKEGKSPLANCMGNKQNQQKNRSMLAVVVMFVAINAL